MQIEIEQLAMQVQLLERRTRLHLEIINLRLIILETKFSLLKK